MTRYRVKICKSPEWRRHRAATLGVSVTSQNCQGEKFAAILAFAAAHFETIRIGVTDALYRHNFMAEGAAQPEARAQADALGAIWLARHQNIIDGCQVKPRVVRWAEWYAHSDYTEVMEGFQQAYRASRTLREAVDADVSKFYQRQGRKPSSMEFDHRRDFPLEEAAVLTLQARALPGLRIYPGTELQSLRLMRAGLVPEAPRGLEQEQFARVQFETRKIAAKPRASFG